MKGGGTEAPHEERQMRGTAKRVVHERGFGFIRAEDGAEVFFHRTDLVDEQLFHELQMGEAVEFTVSQSWRGPRAIHVRLVPSPAKTSGGTFC